MALNNTFRELAISLSPKQTQLVDYTLEDSPVLEMIPFLPTSNGLNHVYEELLDVSGNGMVDMDSELPYLDANTELKQTSVSVLGGQMEVGEDKARQFGGPGAYFQSKLPVILKKSGSDTETSILYNSLRAGAIAAAANTKLVGRTDHLISAGGSDNTNYSIIAVRWEPGAVNGLYDPAGFGNGMFYDMEAINGGELYPTMKSAGKVLGYGMRLKQYIGMLVANPRNVASIVNIDISDADPDNWDLPTANQIDDIVAAVRGTTGGSTMLLMHPKVKTALNEFKASRLQTTVETTNFNRTYEAWNGIPMVETYNFKRGDEPNVAV